MKLSQKGREFIKSHEGLRLKAYQCSAGVWTIGYGHTGGITKGMVITQNIADDYFDADIEKFENAVTSLVKVPLTQSQFDALVSLAFNIGIGAIGKSTLMRKLNQNNYVGAEAQFMAWCKAGGKTNAGLLRRRREEASLFGSEYGVAERVPVRKIDVPPRQKPLAQSRTVIGSALAATGGMASVGQALLDSSTQLTAAQEQAASGQLFGFIIACVIIAGALLALYARISDHKRGL